MAELTDSFDTLADSDTWEQVAVVGAAFMAGTLLKNTVEGRVGFDAPDFAYGVVVVMGATYFLDGDYQRDAQLGGALYAADKLAIRFNIKSRVQNATGGN